MKNLSIALTVFVAGVLFAAQFNLRAQPGAQPLELGQGKVVPPGQQPLITTEPVEKISPSSVLTVMQRVADWQLAHPSAHKPTDWTQGAGDAGMMALVGISGDAKYRDAMLAMGATNEWQLGARKFHADDHAVGQTYAEIIFSIATRR